VDWDFRTNYGEKIGPAATLIHVDLDQGKVGWNRGADIGVIADPNLVVDQLAEAASSFAHDGGRVWSKEIMEEDRRRQAELEREAADAPDSPINPQRFARDVANFFGAEAIVAMDGGDIVSTCARWLQVSHPGFVLDPGPFGTLGTGAPFAIAAKVAYPERTVGIIYGDGAFGFNGFEYDTMVRLGLPIIGVMGNDGVWGNIKTLHKMFFPERLVASDLGRRPYHSVVEALGGYGELVASAEEITPALQRALNSRLPSLINVELAETMRMSSNYGQ
jgi:acetolactate synthase-1/2/3 large subunit